MKRSMRILINEEPHMLEDTNLHNLLVRIGHDTEGAAAAVNNQVIPRAQWINTELHANDQITLFHAIAGG